MFKEDVKEAEQVLDRMLVHLLTVSPTRGRSGSALRRAVGDVVAHAQSLLHDDLIGPPLANCFELARQTGLTMQNAAAVRARIEQEQPELLGAVLIKNAGINFCLVTEARIIADTTFVSRQDIDAEKLVMNDAFNAAEDVAADDMDQMTYQALVALHAAVTFYLVETGRPLPRLLNFQFSTALPTLVMAHKLYADAGRADELRAENKVVHPAFAPRIGVALSK
jgi:prophage DNA circulation protein